MIYAVPVNFVLTGHDWLGHGLCRPGFFSIFMGTPKGVHPWLLNAALAHRECLRLPLARHKTDALDDLATAPA